MSFHSAALPAPDRSALKTNGRRSIAWGINVAALTAFLLGAATCADPGAVTISAQFEHTLLVLIRFMAVAKFAMALGIFALVHWRARQAITPRLTLAYGTAACLMLTSPGLIWSLAHIGLGALLFHAGLLLFIGLVWWDDGLGSQTVPIGLKSSRALMRLDNPSRVSR